MTHVRPVHPVSSEQAAQQCHLSARRGKGGKPWAESTEHGTECVRSSHGSSTRDSISPLLSPPPPPPLFPPRGGPPPPPPHHPPPPPPPPPTPPPPPAPPSMNPLLDTLKAYPY